MKKLITGAIVAAALAVPATPAFAIHDPDVPGENCSLASPGNSQAIGHPAAPVLQGTPAGSPNPGNSDFGVAKHVTGVDPPCHFFFQS
jgi:hypothetical protein